MSDIQFLYDGDDSIENACRARINVEQKEAFFQGFTEAIENGDEEQFRFLVHLVGEMWGVLLTVSNDETKSKFSLHELYSLLWNNVPSIKTGDFHFWSNDDQKNWPSSYISKICFLIAPEKYLIIYDENNRSSLAEYFKKEVTKTALKNEATFMEYVKTYYDREKIGTSRKTIFETDCKLWIHGKMLSGN